MSNSLVVDISKTVHDYAPKEPQEKQYLIDFKILLTKGECALWSDQFEPGHITASAFVLSPDRKAVLMIMHSKLQRWLQPGGHLEKSDVSLLEAVQREVAEETGIEDTELLVDGIFDIDIHEIPARKSKPAHLHFDVRLLLQAKTNQFVFTPEAREIQWVDLEHVPAQFTDPSLSRPIQKVLAFG